MLGKRIQRARKALGLSLRDLSGQIGLSHAAVKKYEDNEATPSSEMLIKLAKALQVKTEYFFRPERVTLDDDDIQYRKHPEMLNCHLKQITARIFDQIERRIELESLLPAAPIKEFSSNNLFKKIKKLPMNKEFKKIEIKDIELLANEVRKKWNLGFGPLTDLIDIFEENGIKIFELSKRQDKKFDGLSASLKLSTCIDNIPVIVISDQWPGDRQRFTLAHELGHFIFATTFSLALDNEMYSNRVEEYCDYFAGAFLLPKDTIIGLLGSHRNYIEPRELSILKQEFGVSMLSILHRAEDVGIIGANLYRQLRSEFNEKGWSKQEPGEQYPQEKTHIFEQMVFHALAEEYISESKAAELMNISLESFRSIRAMEQQDVASY